MNKVYFLDFIWPSNESLRQEYEIILKGNVKEKEVVQKMKRLRNEIQTQGSICALASSFVGAGLSINEYIEPILQNPHPILMGVVGSASVAIISGYFLFNKIADAYLDINGEINHNP